MRGEHDKGQRLVPLKERLGSRYISFVTAVLKDAKTLVTLFHSES
jgi:hypothetical protein